MTQPKRKKDERLELVKLFCTMFSRSAKATSYGLVPVVARKLILKKT